MTISGVRAFTGSLATSGLRSRRSRNKSWASSTRCGWRSADEHAHNGHGINDSTHPRRHRLSHGSGSHQSPRPAKVNRAVGFLLPFIAVTALCAQTGTRSERRERRLLIIKVDGLNADRLYDAMRRSILKRASRACRGLRTYLPSKAPSSTIFTREGSAFRRHPGRCSTQGGMPSFAGMWSTTGTPAILTTT